MIQNYFLVALVYIIAIGVPVGFGYWFGYWRGRSSHGERPEQAQAQQSSEVAKKEV